MLRKWAQTGIFAAVCILINYSLKSLAAAAGIPLWLDSVGTAMAAYALGPVSGAIVGAAVNIMAGFGNPVSFLYALTSIAVGLLIGVWARRKMMDSLFDMLTASTMVGFAAAFISVVINCVVYHGATGNFWGDAIFSMLKEWRIPWVIAAFVAEFFLDFMDKFITIVLLFVMVHGFRALRRYFVKENKGSLAPENSGSEKILSAMLVCVLMLAPGFSARQAEAAEKEGQIDYSEYIQTVYSNSNGLPSGEANDVAATFDGVLWIGTYAGLYRYSGNHFVYKNDFDTIKNVNCLYVDGDGRLWVGTNDDGFSICINEEIAESFDEDDGLPDNSVRSIVQASDGKYYVGTSSSLAVVSIEGGMNLLRTFPEVPYASDLTSDSSGHIAAVTAAGTLFLLNDEGILQRIRDYEGTIFTCCEFTKDGTLLVGDAAGRIHAFTVSGDQLAAGAVLETPGFTWINSLRQIDTGDILICADNGIGWINRDHEIRTINTGSFSSSIYRMTVDYQGGLWFCSSRLGVLKMCDSAFKEVYPEANLTEKVVNAITEWNGCLYFGTDSGLDIVGKASMTAVQNELTESLSGSRIRCLLVDSKNRLWVCNYGGELICVDADGSRKTYSADQGTIGTKFRSAIELSDGTIAAASELGVTYIRDDKVTAAFGVENGLGTGLVLCLFETSDGRVLAGTDGGGISVIENGKITGTLTRKDGLGSGVILRIAQVTGTDRLYVITSNGICLMEPDGTIRKLENFPYSNNYDLCDPGDGTLYVTGSAGIYIVDRKRLLAGKNDLNCVNLNYLNGLRDIFTANAWNYVDEEGNWYIAGGSGVTCYDLNSRREQTNKSFRIMINSITADNTTYSLDGKNSITLARDVFAVQLRPEIVNYSSTEPYVSYWLEGRDSEKTVVLQSELGTILYADLPSGTYKFHLGIQNTKTGTPIEETIFTITKEAKIYDYFWFKIYFFLELLFIVAWFTWLITRKATMRTMELQRREIALAKEQIRMGNETIIAIARTVDAKDSSTSNHSARVADYSVMIARRMGYSDEKLENLRKIALLHDIGKIGVPDAILNKPGKLTPKEYGIMKTHVTRGADILKDFTLIPHVQEGTRYHHERYDGKGYAEGLKGKEIPETARIICVADSFDAMTANRVYRRRLPFAKAVEEIRNGRGTQFDPEIADILLQLIDEGKISEADIGREEQA